MSSADVRSALLSLLLMGDGLHNDDWGDQTNANLTALESAIAGVGQINNAGAGLTGGSITLAAADVLPAVLIFSGTLTANQTVVVPAITKTWLFDNQTTGNFSLIVTTAGGTGVVAMQGSVTEAYCDGTNVKSLSIPGSPIGIVEEYYGVELPDARYVWANGQLLNRVALNAVFNTLTRTTSVTLGGGATQVAASEDLTGKGLIGSAVEGPGVPSGTTIAAVAATTITLSNPTTGAAGATATIRIFPYGNGDGATTFAAPDRRECVPIGSSVMGGTAAPGRISAASMASGANLGQRVGEDQHLLTVAEMPSHNHTLTDPGHNHAVTDPGHKHTSTGPFIDNGVSGSSFGRVASTQNYNTSTEVTGITLGSAKTGITLAAVGGGGAHNNLQPLLVCNYILRVA